MAYVTVARSLLALPVTKRVEGEIIDAVVKKSGKRFSKFDDVKSWMLSSAENAAKGIAAMLGIDLILAEITDSKSLLKSISELFSPSDALELASRMLEARADLKAAIEKDAEAPPTDAEVVSRHRVYVDIASRIAKRFSVFSPQQLIQLRADLAAMSEIPEESWAMAAEDAL